MSLLRTVALFQFRSDAEVETIFAFERDLRTFATSCDGLVEFALGHDMRLRPGTDDLAVYAAFDSRDALEGYLHAPRHAEIVSAYAGAIFSGKHNVQFHDDAS